MSWSWFSSVSSGLCLQMWTLTSWRVRTASSFPSWRAVTSAPSTQTGPTLCRWGDTLSHTDQKHGSDIKSLVQLYTNTISPVVLPQLDAGKQYQYTPPTQPPICPPYQQACHLRKNNLLSREDALSNRPNQSQEETDPPAESTWSVWQLLITWVITKGTVQDCGKVSSFLEDGNTFFFFCVQNKFRTRPDLAKELNMLWTDRFTGWSMFFYVFLILCGDICDRSFIRHTWGIINILYFKNKSHYLEANQHCGLH